MIFLNPAVLFGLLATSIPVLIHLLNLRKLKRIEFSTLSFLKELQKTKIRKVKLKQWILLVLRVLIIAFVVLAFARPTIESVNIGGTTSSAKTSAVFILDNSFSMSVITEKGSYFNRAKGIIKSLLADFQEGDELTLILLSDISNHEIKLSNNFAQFETSLNDAEITDVTQNIQPALKQAVKLLSGSSNFNKEIYILSDYRANLVYGNDNNKYDLKQYKTDNIRLYAFNFPGKDVLNTALTGFKVNNQIFEINRPVSFTATVTNYSDQAVSNNVASLYINGKRTAQQSISLEAGQSKNINFETTLNNTGLLSITAELEDDDILNDNRRYAGIYIPEKISAALFADDPGDLHFLKLALSHGGTDKTINIISGNTSTISSYDLTKFDIVFVIAPGKTINTKRLAEYVSENGSLVLMPGSKSTLNNFGQICRKLKLPAPVSDMGSDKNFVSVNSFDKIDFNHPLLSDLFDKGEKPQIESPDIYRYFKIPPTGRGKAIIKLLDNSLFLGEYNRGKGRVFLFNIAPVLNWSNFPVKGIFAPLINKSVYYLTTKNNDEQQYLTGDKLVFNSAGKTSQQVKVLLPGGEQFYFNLDSLGKNKYAKFNRTDKAGIYKFYSGNKLLASHAVNPNPLESVNDFIDADSLENFLAGLNYKGAFFNVGSDEDYSAVIYKARFGSELWKYFILIALLLAVVEMAVSKNSKKDMAEEI